MTPPSNERLLGQIIERVDGLVRAVDERRAESQSQHEENVARFDGLLVLANQVPPHIRDFQSFREETRTRLSLLEAFMAGIQSERDRRRWLSSKATWLWGLVGAGLTAAFAFYDRLASMLHFGGSPPGPH